jgi:hypothetical protein
MYIESNCLTLRLVTMPNHGRSKESSFLRVLLIFDIDQSGCSLWEGEEGGPSGWHTHTMCRPAHTYQPAHTLFFWVQALGECEGGRVPFGTHTLSRPAHTCRPAHTPYFWVQGLQMCRGGAVRSARTHHVSTGTHVPTGTHAIFLGAECGRVRRGVILTDTRTH